MGRKNIPFSPPDITQNEIDAVVKVLKSGWITSGPNVAEFERRINEYCSVSNSVTVSSATAAMEVVLKTMDIKEGDEVITTPYTYTASASSVLHRGAKPVFVDVKKDSFMLDAQRLYDAITPNTKVITTVDVAGVPFDYDTVREVLKAKNREDILFLSDSAHSFGATYKGKKVGSQADFHAFSFHAVKNLTTAEGGAITFNDNNFKGNADLFKMFKLNSLHGQSKDALSKMKAGAWQYDIITDGYKCNMTDMQAALGLVQLDRYEEMLERRREVFELYSNKLSKTDWAILPFQKENGTETSYHLYLLRIRDFSAEKRNSVIQSLAEMGIATNVHYMPLPMFTLYKNLGYKMEDYPNAYNQYINEISLPLYSILTLEDADYVVTELINCVEKIR